MRYSKDYFKIQLNFAERVSAITGKKIEETLFSYTAIPKAIGIKGWNFNEQDLLWQDFLKGFRASRDRLEYIYSLCHADQAPSGLRKLFGCFWYEFDEEKNQIKIHFRNNDLVEPGALSKERFNTRKSELKEMFEEINEKYPQAETVVGFSWLYNIGSYTRLFPNEYSQNVLFSNDWFRSVALWGQFIYGNGEIREEVATNFNKCIQNKTTINELADCFPYKVLIPNAHIKNFYKFYNIN